MSERIYKHYLYLAGVRVPFISDFISSQFGSLASANIELPYSPFILNMHEYTKVEIYEQINDNGKLLEPTLEFDGVVIGVTKNKNVLGEVSARLTCLTDGVIWNQRKQYDFYLTDILDVKLDGTDTVANMRADGSITNFFNEILQNNRFDIGCAVGSVLTSQSKAYKGKIEEQSQNVVQSSYTYIYNGKQFKKTLNIKNDGLSTTPKYYERFLQEYHLQNKIYGISTSESIKEFFRQDNFIKLITNNINDLRGENSFWTIASTVLQYGFYNIYDIPNPTYINISGSDKTPIDLNVLTTTEVSNNKDKNTDVISSHPDVTSVNAIKNNRPYKGLGEYLLKPISVLGIPYKCNVIWPDQVLQESLFYDFINSPTRVLYQRQGLPGVTDAVVLTTTTLAGPHFKDPNTNYFGSFNTPTVDSDHCRPQTVYSDYEKEYGLRSHRLNISYAFDEALLKNDNKDSKHVNKKLNNFLNYEFAQRFLSSRNYSIQVTPDVSVIAGMSTVVLNNEGQHIVCFCTGVDKSWNTNGQKSVRLAVSYPRYYYEKIGELGNVIDPVSQDIFAINELNTIIGSKPLDGFISNDKINNSSDNLMYIIEKLFENYKSSKNSDVLKLQYKRKVCSYKEFMSLHEITATENFEDVYDGDLFNSTTQANELSSHQFRVYNTEERKVYNYENYFNRSIIKEHINWTGKDQRV